MNMIQIDWGQILATLLGVVSGIISAYLAFKAKEKDNAQQLIDQLQEERDRYYTQLSKIHQEKLAAAEKYWQEKSIAREHVQELRAHIWEKKDPPPPQPPTGYQH